MVEKIKYFDVHSHLHSSFFQERENSDEVIKKMKKNLFYSITIGVDFLDSTRAINMALKHENLFCSIGQHPVDNLTEVFNERKYQELLNKNKKKLFV